MAHVAAFGTTPKLLDEFATKVGFATAAIGDHRASAGTRKTATGQLALKIDALLALPEKEIDPVLAPSRKTDRALWLRDQNARQIMDRLGTRCVADAPGTTAPTPDARRPTAPPAGPANLAEKQAAWPDLPFSRIQTPHVSPCGVF